MSDTLNNFYKLALEKGLVKSDSDDTKKIDKKKEIELLYRVKPQSIYDYENNIGEAAHKETAVVNTAHDKINALIENDNERQNIILNLLKSKTPRGYLSNHKLAQKNLLLSLVKIGNYLDNTDNDELRVIADVCLEQTSSIKKEAFYPLVAATTAALLGALYLQQHIGFTNEGFEKNHQKLIAELDDMIESNSNWGSGYQYKANFYKLLVEFKTKLTSFYSKYKSISSLIESIEQPRTSEQLLELSKQPKTDLTVKAYQMFQNEFNQVLPYIVTMEKNFASETYKAKQIEDKGFLTSLVDKVQALHGGKGLVADDFDDIVRALTPYKQSIQDVLKVLDEAKSIQESAEAKLQEAQLKESDIKEVTVEDAGVSDDIEKEVSDLEKQLQGGIF